MFSRMRLSSTVSLAMVAQSMKYLGRPNVMIVEAQIRCAGWVNWMNLGCYTHRRAFLLIAAIAIIPLQLSISSTSVFANNTKVLQIVEGLNTTLLSIMQSAETLGYQGRYERLDEPLRQSFDFAFMTKIAVGRAWNDFDKEQRQQLIERFTKMSVATFAARFDGYSGEYFEIVGQKSGRKDTIIVDDRIIRPKDPPVGLNFVLKEQSDEAADEEWRIIDVMLDGKFSELARQRAEFSAVLKRGGYDELISALDERIEILNAES